jgi:hypothetical protein
LKSRTGKRKGIGVEEKNGGKDWREGQEKGLKRRNGIGIEERDGKKQREGQEKG